MEVLKNYLLNLSKDENNCICKQGCGVGVGDAGFLVESDS